MVLPIKYHNFHPRWHLQDKHTWKLSAGNNPTKQRLLWTTSEYKHCKKNKIKKKKTFSNLVVSSSHNFHQASDFFFIFYSKSNRIWHQMNRNELFHHLPFRMPESQWMHVVEVLVLGSRFRSVQLWLQNREDDQHGAHGCFKLDSLWSTVTKKQSLASYFFHVVLNVQYYFLQLVGGKCVFAHRSCW